ncbi:poly(A) polymerase [Geothermobacter ehrlichii]|uniref:Poly(A) polymerase n=2 Tax=Geothermobacter ehrlichii TaxID=213224 RepID=A0A5D3WP20_9BACT|nr:poly(A) polymerase [Geothermobacter ehrlichii]
MRPALEAVPGFGRLLSRLRRNGQPAWLVGGVLRDWVLGRPLVDIDLAVGQDCEPLARRLATEGDGSWFWLDRERGQCRVVLSDEAGRTFCYDLSPFKGGSLLADLGERDFTINAMALPLDEAEGRLVDPYGGMRDLAGKRLRVTTPGVMQQDPLRILRGLRFARILEFDFDPLTFELMKRAAPTMIDLPGERVSMELALILSLPLRRKLLAEIERLHLFASLGLKKVGFWSTPEEQTRIQALEAAIAAVPERLAARDIAGGWSAAALVRLHLLLKAPDEDAVRALAARLRLPRNALKALLGLHRLENLSLPPVPATSRRRRLWLQQLPGHPGCCLLHFLAFGRQGESDASGPALLAADALALAAGEIPPPLVPATELAAELGIARGPLVGRLLQRLVSAEIAGLVDDRTEAIDWLKKELEMGIDKGSNPT